MEVMYKVYVCVDNAWRVTAINSSAFLRDTDGWIQIDEGSGYRHLHAQAHYLDKPITDERGIYRYKMENDVIVERTAEEMDADIETEQSAPSNSDARIAALEKQVAAQAQLLAAYEAAYAEGVQSA